MVATGTGISPIKSMLLHFSDTRKHDAVRLFLVSATTRTFPPPTSAADWRPATRSSLSTSALPPDPEARAGPRGGSPTYRPARPAGGRRETEVYLCGGRDMIR